MKPANPGLFMCLFDDWRIKSKLWLEFSRRREKERFEILFCFVKPEKRRENKIDLLEP